MPMTKNIFLTALLLFCALRSHAATYIESSIRLPAIDREFRGVWIATDPGLDHLDLHTNAIRHVDTGSETAPRNFPVTQRPESS